jgi:hypothetical protein
MVVLNKAKLYNNYFQLKSYYLLVKFNALNKKYSIKMYCYNKFKYIK